MHSAALLRCWSVKSQERGRRGEMEEKKQGIMEQRFSLHHPDEQMSLRSRIKRICCSQHMPGPPCASVFLRLLTVLWTGEQSRRPVFQVPGTPRTSLCKWSSAADLFSQWEEREVMPLLATHPHQFLCSADDPAEYSWLSLHVRVRINHM